MNIFFFFLNIPPRLCEFTSRGLADFRYIHDSPMGASPLRWASPIAADALLRIHAFIYREKIQVLESCASNSTTHIRTVFGDGGVGPSIRGNAISCGDHIRAAIFQNGDTPFLSSTPMHEAGKRPPSRREIGWARPTPNFRIGAPAAKSPPISFLEFP